MNDFQNDDAELRAVTLQNARSVFLARQRAEQELVRVNEALRRSERELSDFFDNAAVGLHWVGPDGLILRVNQAELNLLGYAREEYVGRHIAEFHVDQDVITDILRRLAAGETLHDVEARMRCRDGSVKHVLIDSSVMRQNGEFIHTRCFTRDITDRKRVEEVQRRLAAIVESSQDAIISKTVEGRLLSWNAAAEQLFGYRADEIIGDTIYRLIPEDRQDEERMILERLRRGERVDHYETARVAKSGRRVDVSLTISPLRDDVGRSVGAATIVRDITARKRAEHRLAMQNQVTRTLAESQTLADAAPALLQGICDHLEWQVGALWYLDDTANVLRCLDVYHAPSVQVPRFAALSRSRTFERGVGLPGRVWAGAAPVCIPDVGKDDNFPRAPSAVAERLHGAVGFPIKLNDHVLGVMEFFSHEIREPDDEVLQMMAATGSQVGQFIERRRAEAALRESERTSRFLADASAALAAVTDYEATLQSVATLAVPHFADWCAIDLRQPDGSLRRLVVTHRDPAKVQLARELEQKYPPSPDAARGVANVIRTGETEWAASIPDELLVAGAQDEEHLRIIRGLGLKSYICVPLKTRARVLGAFTFVTAESGRIYTEGDVRAAEDLAHRGAIAIDNAALLATLQEADRRKDEFLAMLAHELRNPLAPIRNAVQIFRAKGPGTPELQWATEVIDRQVLQMTHLVDDLLDVSRITRGKIVLRKEVVNLATVVNSAVEASRPLIEKWGHALIVTLPPEPVYLDADTTRLAQVFLNLLNNAAKYTDPGGRIALVARRRDTDVEIQVQDTGIGIPAEALPRIFDMFAQVERSVERSEGGLGIGLTLVQRLVTMHGGTVEARSGGPGKGSEFIVRLPIAAAPSAGTPRSASAIGTATTTSAPVRRILVVDDNQDAAESLALLFRMSGNDVVTAHDGLAAVQSAQSFHPHVVVMDVGLPRLNGNDAARRMREQDGGQEMILVALTGWGHEDDRRRCREAGFDHHMTKPVDFDALQDLLTRSAPRTYR